MVSIGYIGLALANLASLVLAIAKKGRKMRTIAYFVSAMMVFLPTMGGLGHVSAAELNPPTEWVCEETYSELLDSGETMRNEVCTRQVWAKQSHCGSQDGGEWGCTESWGMTQERTDTDYIGDEIVYQMVECWDAFDLAGYASPNGDFCTTQEEGDKVANMDDLK